jgi:hypothetical protein
MDYIKANYERLLLLLSGLILLAVSFHAVSSFSALESEYLSPAIGTRGAPFVPDAALARLQGEAGKIADPSKSLWEERDRSLFVSRVYLLRDGKLVDIFESDAQLYPGIENAWILKHSLDYTDPDLAAKDPDTDGFTNIEEFRAGKNPMDPDSKPDVWTKLRLAATKIDKLRTKFESLPEGDLETVQINTVSAEDPRALTGESRFYKKGDMITLSETGPDGRKTETPTPLQFVEARLINRLNPKTNSEEEVPVITLLNTADSLKIELTQGEVKDSPYSLATLVDTRTTGKEVALRTGQQFELDPGQSYKLVDVSEEAATIQDLASGDRFTIPRLEINATLQPPSEP